MPDEVKVTITERNGVELAYPEEHRYHADNQPFNPAGSPFTVDSTELAIKESVNLTGVALSSIVFGRDGNRSSGTWLEAFKGIATNASPLVIGGDYELLNVTLSNKKNRTGTITIYINGVVVTTISTINAKTAEQVVTGVFAVPGDELSAKISSGSFNDVIISMTFKGTI